MPDLKRRLPGRGLWITATRQALADGGHAQGVRARFQARRPRRADLVDLTERLIERAALDALAIAHKAGKVAIGFAKTETAIDARARWSRCIHAPMPPPTGSRKLNAAAAQALWPESGGEIAGLIRSKP